MKASINDNMLIYQSEMEGSRQMSGSRRKTVWLTQAQMCTLSGRGRRVITKYINNIFEEGEFDENSNVQKLHIANSNKPVRYNNFDVIISAGYCVKSQQGTRFRIWAIQRQRATQEQ